MDAASELPLLSQLLTSAATLAYGVGPFLVDLNKTHLLHPAWPGHARFHLLWSAIGQCGVATVALWLVWNPTPEIVANNRLASVIGLAMTGGFWGALLFKKLYRGTLHDPGGIPPFWGKLDGNLLAVTAIDVVLLAGLGLTF